MVWGVYMIRTEQLYYLTQVAHYGSINKAAEKLYRTNVAISKAIGQLEKECGYDILERTYRGVGLTEKGKEAVKIAERILALHEELVRLGEDATTVHPKYKLLIDQKVFRLLSSKFMNPHTNILEYFEIKEVKDAHKDFREQFHDKTVILCLLSEKNLLQLTQNEKIQVHCLYESKQYPVSSKKTKWIKKNQTCISVEEYTKLPKIQLRYSNDSTLKMIDNIVLEAEDPYVYSEAILADYGIGLITRFASDICAVDYKKFKIYEPFDEKVYIAFIARNDCEQDVIEQLKRVIQEKE